MKKLSIIAALVCVLCLNAVVASAALTVTPALGEDTVSVEVSGTTNYADRVTVLAVEGTKALDQYTEEELDALLGNVTYIDQTTAVENAAAFEFVPRDNAIADNQIIVYASDGVTTASSAPLSTLKQHTVTFKYEFGTFATETVDEGTLLTEVVAGLSGNPSRVGYTFAGWTLDGADLTDQTVTRNMELVAKWTANFAAITTDTGYCTTETDDGVVNSGVVSVLAKYEGDITYTRWCGFYVWKGTTNITVGVPGVNYKRVVGEITGKPDPENGLFTLITDIPEAKYGEGVVIIPFITNSIPQEVGQNKEVVVLGAPTRCTLDAEGLKYLGDLDAVKAALAEEAAK